MSTCSEIDTLAMAYVDGELAPEERRELELHLLECEVCRSGLQDLSRMSRVIRDALLATPPAPDALRTRIIASLDATDRDARRARRSVIGHWALYVSAAALGVTALALFAFGTSTHPTARAAVVSEAVRQAQNSSMPLEVQGPNTRPWLEEHSVPVPRAIALGPDVEELGARLTAVNGHDAAMVSLRVQHADATVPLTEFIVKHLNRDELATSQQFEVAGITLNVFENSTGSIVAYVNDIGDGYIFVAPIRPASDLVDLVVSSRLIGR